MNRAVYQTRASAARTDVVSLLLVAAAWLIPATGAAGVVEVPPDAARVPLTAGMQCFRDTTDALTIEDVSSTDWECCDSGSEARTVCSSFAGGTIWARVTLTSLSSRGDTRILTVPFPHALEVTLYTPGESGGFSAQQVGWLSTNGPPERVPAFTVDLPPNVPQTLYLRVRVEGPVVLSPELFTLEAHAAHERTHAVMDWGFIMMVVLFAAYHLGAFLLTGSRASLWLIPYLLAAGAFYFVLSGCAAPILAGPLRAALPTAYPVTLSTAVLAGFLFLRAYFCTPQTMPRLDKLVRWLCACTVMVFVGSFVSSRFGIFGGILLAALFVGIQALAAFQRVGERERPTWFYRAGIVALTAGCIAGFLLFPGLLPHGPVTGSLPAAGFQLFAFLSTVAVAGRVRRMQRAHHAEVRRLNWRLITTEQRERAAVSRELHDGACQNLATAKLTLSLLRDNCRYCKAGTREAFGDMIRLVTESYEQIRAVIYTMDPPVLHELGLGAALQRLAHDLTAALPVTVEVNVQGDEEVLHASGRGLIYRFARELLVNVIKHAGARNAQISLSLDEEQATLCMKDDGVGFTPGESPEGQRLSLGFGLSDIQQQVLSLGGTFRAENAQPEGALIRLSVPGESMVSDVGVEP